MIAKKGPAIEMEFVTDAVEIAQAQARRERFERNLAWFQAHADQIYKDHRGKCICIAGQELFIADSPHEVLQLARAAHPQDEGRLHAIFLAKGCPAFMLLKGLWLLCDDSVVRPVIHGEVSTQDRTRVQTPFLVDPAADRTVFSADIFHALGLPQALTSQQLSGVGGVAVSVVIDAQIEFEREEPGPVVFRGQFAAFADMKALDMSVLGRDILNLFAVIVDRPADTVCVLGQQHYYTIQTR